MLLQLFLNYSSCRDARRCGLARLTRLWTLLVDLHAA